MKLDMKDWGPATTLVVASALIVIVIGGIVVIVGDALTFDQYINKVIGAAVALGLLSVGRGVRLQNQPVPDPNNPIETSEPNPASTPREVKGKPRARR